MTIAGPESRLKDQNPTIQAHVNSNRTIRICDAGNLSNASSRRSRSIAPAPSWFALDLQLELGELGFTSTLDPVKNDRILMTPELAAGKLEAEDS